MWGDTTCVEGVTCTVTIACVNVGGGPSGIDRSAECDYATSLTTGNVILTTGGVPTVVQLVIRRSSLAGG